MGASPEMLVKVNHERKIETHPIAGTRKRGKDPIQDDALAKELLADEKVSVKMHRFIRIVYSCPHLYLFFMK